MTRDIPISHAADEKLLLSGYPRDACVHHLFGALSRRRPEAPALLTRGGAFSYGEIDARSNQLARHLQQCDVRPGEIVAFLTKRSVSTIVGWLAALKCGAAYMPLDPTYPTKSLEFMLSDAAPALVLLDHEFTELAGSIGATRVRCLQDEVELSVEKPADPLPVSGAAKDRAYILYTSGSTGRPKGVEVHHRGIIRLVRGQTLVTLDENETQLLTSALGFDFATHNVWGSLLNGGRLAIVEGEHLSLDDIAEAIAQFSVTTIGLSTAIFHLFAEQRLDSLRPLRQVIVGGDVLSPEHARKFLDRLPHCRLINGYGPTENTTFTTFYDVPRSGWGSGPIPIGRPIEHTTVYILDESRKTVEPGAAGFLWTGGDGVALGYLNRPELTAERFLPDPFSGEPCSTMYATGDLSRFRPDGEIEFLGRKDRQVKISGKRIELDEIEMVLRQDDAIDDAMVLLRSLGGDDKRIVAFAKPVVGMEKAGLLDGLRARISDRLPDHMVPTDIRIVASFPLTPNGKVDRDALLNEGAKPLKRPSEILLPLDELERKLAEIWQSVLQLEAVGRNENFFDLGGKSLHLMQIHAELVRTVAPGIDIVTLFRNPTIISLAHFIRQGTAGNDLEAAARDRAHLQQAALKRARAARPGTPI